MSADLLAETVLPATSRTISSPAHRHRLPCSRRPVAVGRLGARLAAGRCAPLRTPAKRCPQAFAVLFADEYRRNRTTGSFILIDEATNETVGAGMILGPTT